MASGGASYGTTMTAKLNKSKSKSGKEVSSPIEQKGGMPAKCRLVSKQ